uniref:Kinesin motor domain-containing protein n=1 Tax=Brassica oleracea var. oleracea TaxID=109376 RepID=A0A0D3B0B4_BRAOL
METYIYLSKVADKQQQEEEQPSIEEQEELNVADEQQQEEEQPAIEQHEQQEEEEQPAIEQQQELEDIDMIRNIGKQKCSQMKSQIMVRNVRVFSRVRLLLPGQGAANSVVEYIGEDGELVVRNPVRNSTKPGKDFCMFKFNKVYTPAATQAEVFKDIEPLVRSVMDGFNVCIFAYGQTRSGKTYTMTLFRNLIVLLEQCAKKKNIKKKKKQSCKKILGPIKRFDGDVVEYLKVMLLSLVHKSRAGQGRI